MSPYMFDAEEDGKTFKLATGMGLEEIALSLANPDLIFIGSNPVDSGTLSFTLDGDKASFHAEMTTVEHGMTIVYAFDVEITEIGTTELGYDLANDYIPFKEAESWADVDGAEELVEQYGYGSLPFFTVSGGQWAAFTEAQGGPCLQFIAPSADAL